MKKSFIVHPFIVAAFPALALYYYNAQDLRLSVLVLPVLVPIGVALLMFLITWSICGNPYKSGIIVSLFLALLYSSGHVFNVASWYGITSPYLGGVILFLIWAIIFPGSAYLILRTRKTLRYPTIILNAIFIFMLLSYSVRTGIYEVKRLSAGSDTPASPAGVPAGIDSVRWSRTSSPGGHPTQRARAQTSDGLGNPGRADLTPNWAYL